MALSSGFGFCVFLMGRTIYGKPLKKKQADRPRLVGIVSASLQQQEKRRGVPALFLFDMTDHGSSTSLPV